MTTVHFFASALMLFLDWGMMWSILQVETRMRVRTNDGGGYSE